MRSFGGSFSPLLCWVSQNTDNEPFVVCELGFAKRRLSVTAIRVFLHSLVFADDAPRLLGNVDRFLAIATAQQIKVGLAFFGDCFNHAPIAVVDADPLPPAAASFLAMAAGVSEVRVDYASALPDSVL